MPRGNGRYDNSRYRRLLQDRQPFLVAPTATPLMPGKHRDDPSTALKSALKTGPSANRQGRAHRTGTKTWVYSLPRHHRPANGRTTPGRPDTRRTVSPALRRHARESLKLFETRPARASVTRCRALPASPPARSARLGPADKPGPSCVLGEIGQDVIPVIFSNWAVAISRLSRPGWKRDYFRNFFWRTELKPLSDRTTFEGALYAERLARHAALTLPFTKLTLSGSLSRTLATTISPRIL